LLEFVDHYTWCLLDIKPILLVNLLTQGCHFISIAVRLVTLLQ